ncbi:hypothetical protein ABZT49_12880 [Methylobacterium sp. EM32]|uniref:hypothetical protein n=1 Tax=Methylobacterium sp. EM32 TaxID=3163481 RepID=UPI0033AA7213
MYDFIKIFGERNCGTNFLIQLCSRNFTAIKVLEHGDNTVPNSRSHIFDENFRYFALNRLIDNQRLEEFQSNFGWKHSAVTSCYLRMAEIFDKTMFLFIVKNPYSYLNSLFRRPYNLMPLRNTTKSEFLRSAFIANQRDNLDDILIESPIDLWNRKTKSYLTVVNDISNARLIRYEDLVVDLAGFLEWIHSSGVSLAGKITIPAESTKGDPLLFTDYRDAVLSYNPQSDFPLEDIDYIDSYLDKDLVHTLKYDNINSISIPKWQGKYSFER